MKSPADVSRIKGSNVVLTPMGNENDVAQRNLANLNSIFCEQSRM